jgi:hypothetical protein
MTKARDLVVKIYKETGVLLSPQQAIVFDYGTREGIVTHDGIIKVLYPGCIPDYGFDRSRSIISRLRIKFPDWSIDNVPGVGYIFKKDNIATLKKVI